MISCRHGLAAVTDGLRKMEYMTLLERDERNIEKGIGIGEEMFVRLIQVLTEKGLQSEIDAVLKDKGYREVLYKKYGIK